MSAKKPTLTMLDLVTETNMIQITKGNFSLRIRPNNRLDGEYFCSIRKSKVMEDLAVVSIRTKTKTVRYIERFLAGTLPVLLENEK